MKENFVMFSKNGGHLFPLIQFCFCFINQQVYGWALHPSVHFDHVTNIFYILYCMYMLSLSRVYIKRNARNAWSCHFFLFSLPCFLYTLTETPCENRNSPLSHTPLIPRAFVEQWPSSHRVLTEWDLSVESPWTAVPGDLLCHCLASTQLDSTD